MQITEVRYVAISCGHLTDDLNGLRQLGGKELVAGNHELLDQSCDECNDMLFVVEGKASGGDSRRGGRRRRGRGSECD